NDNSNQNEDTPFEPLTPAEKIDFLFSKIYDLDEQLKSTKEGNSKNRITRYLR
ncbi:conserved protein, unknown function, partial [Hepatocystis sp. ex Piliocolobus tephrosceles]